ncbi:glutathione S-transferase N-terminal domain-containing protein [Aquabacter cavernae]|uniref:glutathione S-transferase N-terminal domain-containing protein n=1 Tax=Aquabacter cavernae TaxID=2496029 RepID=UPI000F8F6730|nr:glutathione S-transferase N-terminal domain-containing protein [Aquabacter cavernae]
MIDLLYWTTPNGQKVLIAVEELGLPYEIKPVNISKGEQFQPDFLRNSPNNRIPAIVDHAPEDGDGPLAVFESGACLEYLADKTGRFLAKSTRRRFEALQWLYWQMGGLGPMAGQAHHFIQYAADQHPYAIERYVKEANRLYGVLDRRLALVPYAGGEDYTIADMAIYPWIYRHERHRQDLNDFPNVKRWYEIVGARPAVKRAYEIQDAINVTPTVSAESHALLFGQTAELPKV